MCAKTKVPGWDDFVGTWLPCFASLTMNSSCAQAPHCDHLSLPSTIASSFRPLVAFSPSFLPLPSSPSLPGPFSFAQLSPFPLVLPFPKMIPVISKCKDLTTVTKNKDYFPKEGTSSLFLCEDYSCLILASCVRVCLVTPISKILPRGSVKMI